MKTCFRYLLFAHFVVLVILFTACITYHYVPKSRRPAKTAEIEPPNEEVEATRSREDGRKETGVEQNFDPAITVGDLVDAPSRHSFEQSQHSWFLSQNFPPEGLAKAIAWGTVGYCHTECTEDGCILCPRVEWFTFSDENGELIFTFPISFTAEEREIIGKIRTVDEWGIPWATQSNFVPDSGTAILTTTRWIFKLCEKAERGYSCSQAAAIQAVEESVVRLEELLFFSDMSVSACSQ